MRILLATPLYAPDIGGPATHARFAQQELTQQGYIVDVVPFSLVRHYPKVVRHLAYFWLVVRRARGAAAIYALDPVSVGLPAWCAAALSRTPFVLRVAGDYAWEQGTARFGVSVTLDEFLATRRMPLVVRFFRMVQRFVAGRAVRIVVPSDYFKSVIVRWGIAPQNIAVVYSTLEPIHTLPRDAARDLLGVRGPLLVSAGRLVKWKGFPALLEAFKEVHSVFPDAQLRIVGSGPERAVIEQNIAALGLAESVLLEGQLPQDELWQRIAAADVFVLNTQYEGLSHQLIEVMQLGVPIVTTPVGGNRELIDHSVSGLLCAPSDVAGLQEAMQRLLADANLATRLAAQAQQKLLQFSPEQSAASLIHIFRTLGIVPHQGLRVCMLSGDAHALSAQSGVHGRLLLQAAEVDWLSVFVRAGRARVALGVHGEVEGLPGFKLRSAWRMYRRAVASAPDVVTAQDPFLLGLVGWLVARRVKVPLQLQVHTNICAPEFAVAHPWQVRLARFLLPRAHSVRVVSEYVAQEIRRRYPALAVSVLPIYVDAQRVVSAPVSTLFDAYSALPARVLIVSRLEAEKRVGDRLEELVPLLRQIPDAGVFVVGDGSQKVALQAKTKSLGIADRVVFLGYRHDVYALYKAATVVVAATAAYEGYGAATVEALLAGAPVLSLDVGIAKEAGATIYTTETFLTEAVSILREGKRGSLATQLPTPQAWARAWREGIEMCTR